MKMLTATRWQGIVTASALAALTLLAPGALNGLSQQPAQQGLPARSPEQNETGSPGQTPSPGSGDGSVGKTPAADEKAGGRIGDRDSVYFYAFLENNEDLPPAPILEFLKDKPVFQELINKARWEDRRFRPMMQWYYWANKPEPFLPALLFSLLSTLITWSIFPRWLSAGESACRQNFWKSLGTGVLVAAVAVIFMRAVFLSQIGWSLGIFVSAVFQLGLLCGYGVAVSLVGSSASYYLRLDKWPFLNAHQDARRVAELSLGVLVCVLLLQIPGVGCLPRIGTRLVALLAVLGAGGLYKSRPRGAASSLSQRT